MTVKKPEPKIDQFHTLARDVRTKDLAEVLGMTQPATSKLYAQRVILQNGKRGRYDLFDTVPRYIQSIRSSGTAEAGARLKIAQRQKLEIENQRVRGELVKIDDAAEVFRAACISWRAGASAIPRRLATELSNTKSAAACRELLVNEFAALFVEFEKPLREYFGDALDLPTPGKSRTNGATPAAKKVPRRMGGRKPNTTARKRRTRKMAK